MKRRRRLNVGGVFVLGNPPCQSVQAVPRGALDGELLANERGERLVALHARGQRHHARRQLFVGLQE